MHRKLCVHRKVGATHCSYPPSTGGADDDDDHDGGGGGNGGQEPPSWGLFAAAGGGRERENQLDFERISNNAGHSRFMKRHTPADASAEKQKEEKKTRRSAHFFCASHDGAVKRPHLPRDTQKKRPSERTQREEKTVRSRMDEVTMGAHFFAAHTVKSGTPRIQKRNGRTRRLHKVGLCRILICSDSLLLPFSLVLSQSPKCRRCQL